jgi:adenosylcobyric acid synthase
VRGYLINKFRGDVRLFDNGLTAITELTGWPSLGVVPWLPQAALLPAEDAVDLDRARASDAKRVIAVPMLARIANFDDLDPLGMEPGVKLIFVPPGQPIPADASVVIIPGSKSTLGDLAFMRAQGWDIDIAAHVRRGGHLLGLCGGYQMLGRSIADPDGIDGAPGTVDGLGLLDINTIMQGDKSTTLVTGTHSATGARVEGYEIHLGRSHGPDCARPVVTIDDRPDGAISHDGRVQGTYLHGLFTNDHFRKAWLSGLGIASELAYDSQVEAALDKLADHLETHLDVEQMIAIARSRQSTNQSAA